MQSDLPVAQTVFEIGAVLAKLTSIERTVTLGTAFAEALNEAIPLHLHQAHLQLLMHCATAAMKGASPEHRAAAVRALQGLVTAAESVNAETPTLEVVRSPAASLKKTKIIP